MLCGAFLLLLHALPPVLRFVPVLRPSPVLKTRIFTPNQAFAQAESGM
jgi:hypothetical protein